MRFLLAILLLAAAPLFAAKPTSRLERDLGQGLAYVRVRALPADLPLAPAKPGAIVLDLRYAATDPAGVSALDGWIHFRAKARTPVLVLVNSATAAALLDYLEANPAPPGLVTLGPASSRFVPDLALKIAAPTERAAYDALDQGASVESLLADNPGKPRHDEAEVAQQHALAPAASDDDDADLSDGDAPEAATPAPPAPLIDATLQRAVHLHRALLALRKI